MNVGLDFYIHLKSEQTTRLWNWRRALAQKCAVGKRMGKRRWKRQKALLGRLFSALLSPILPLCDKSCERPRLNNILLIT